MEYLSSAPLSAPDPLPAPERVRRAGGDEGDDPAPQRGREWDWGPAAAAIGCDRLEDAIKRRGGRRQSDPALIGREVREGNQELVAERQAHRPVAIEGG